MQLGHQTVKIILTQNMTLSLTPEGKAGLGLDIRLQSPPSQPPCSATTQHQGSLSLTVTCCSEMCSCRVWLPFCNEVLSTVLLNILLFYILAGLFLGVPYRLISQVECISSMSLQILYLVKQTLVSSLLNTMHQTIEHLEWTEARTKKVVFLKL